MPKSKQTDYWFKRRDQGWGWGLPVNLKGWISYGVFVAIWFGSLAWFTASLNGEPIPIYKSVLFVLIILLDVAGLLFVSSKYGELTLPNLKKRFKNTKSTKK